MATIKDVSQLARVSQATVSRVLNGGVPVSPEKQAAVLAAIERLGYRPNAFARSLATNRSGAIGALVSELSSAVYGDIIRGIESVARNTACTSSSRAATPAPPPSDAPSTSSNNDAPTR
jgi:LacI family transcriptional regulator